MSASPSTKHRGRNVHSSSLSKKLNRENSSSKLNKNLLIPTCVNADDISNHFWRENENFKALLQKYQSEIASSGIKITNLEQEIHKSDQKFRVLTDENKNLLSKILSQKSEHLNEIEKLNKKHSTEIQKLENLLKKNSYEKASKKKSLDTEEFKKFYDHNKNSNQKLKSKKK